MAGCWSSTGPLVSWRFQSSQCCILIFAINVAIVSLYFLVNLMEVPNPISLPHSAFIARKTRRSRKYNAVRCPLFVRIRCLDHLRQYAPYVILVMHIRRRGAARCPPASQTGRHRPTLQLAGAFPASRDAKRGAQVGESAERPKRVENLGWQTARLLRSFAAGVPITRYREKLYACPHYALVSCPLTE